MFSRSFGDTVGQKSTLTNKETVKRPSPTDPSNEWKQKPDIVCTNF